MPISRRTLLAAAAAAALPLPSAAQELMLQPVTPTALKNTRYAKHANPGSLGAAPPAEIQVGGLKLVAYAPRDAQRGRVVVFSHGEQATPRVYDGLLSHWASHGYFVLAPVHDDSVLNAGARDLSALVNDVDAWRSRVLMVKATLDAASTLERTYNLRLNTERAILAGHSYGAFTAQVLMGARALSGPGVVFEEPDPRFHAAMLLSPQGRGSMGLVDGSWDTVTRPLLVCTGSGDIGAGGQAPEAKAEPFLLSPAGNKHLAWFQRMRPTLYSGQRTTIGAADLPAYQDLLAVTTAFLYSYADRDEEVFRELAGDYYGVASNNRLAMRYR